MGINGRSKGKRGERKAAALIAKWTGKKFASTPASGGLQWTAAHSKGDVTCTTEGHFFPFCIEVKNYSKIDFSHLLVPGLRNIEILQYWDQCARDAKICKKIPMLLMRYNGLPSDFFFVVIERTFAQIIHTDLTIGCPGFRTLRYQNYKNGRELMMFDSNQFFKVDYKDVKRTAKNHIKFKYP